MSKKKSMAWDRKTSGHISTGVVNYSRLAQFGQSSKPRKSLKPKSLRDKFKRIDDKHEHKRKGIKFLLD